ncbi:1,2-dihydroxy-3-keto-5-methylthiopentene dioxygenase 2-like [Zingiber officinale]|uniref:1,2-dihydroxy-3-keto-5-methylthiopentene dioxygenase 2-like n=1 Tax=Zingiber officinale TaxID=94328 RepID=UPI001C4D53A6|nr:1,2-dihydroxy-3-keto-5-methylthiopentene dioxygenase 2-like [Zingiber officinale]
METALYSQGVEEEIVEAWHIKDSEEEEDHRLPKHCEPKEFVSLHKLEDLGIRTWRVGSDYENEEQVKQIRESRGYSHSCTLDLHPERLPNFEQILKRIFVEHLHLDDEISYCIQGSGYHDVRDENDRWIRIAVKEGVMILLPAGIYHRLALDLNNYLKILIFNAGPAVDITTYERPGDDLLARKLYLETLHKKGC